MSTAMPDPTATVILTDPEFAAVVDALRTRRAAEHPGSAAEFEQARNLATAAAKIEVAWARAQAAPRPTVSSPFSASRSEVAR